LKKIEKNGKIEQKKSRMCDIVELNDKLMKQIADVKYLVRDNAYKYSTIIRFLFAQYEKLNYYFIKRIFTESSRNMSFFWIVW